MPQMSVISRRPVNGSGTREGGPRTMPQSNRRRVASVTAALLLTATVAGAGVAVAQSESPAASMAPAAPWPTPATGVTGTIDIHGSSTVAPISRRSPKRSRPLNPDWAFLVGDEGTGAGSATSSAPAGPTSRMPLARSARKRQPPARPPASASGAPHRLRRDRDHHVGREHRHRVPDPGGPVRANRPRVQRLRELGRCAGAGDRAGIAHHVPRCAAGDHGPRR